HGGRAIKMRRQAMQNACRLAQLLQHRAQGGLRVSQIGAQAYVGALDGGHRYCMAARFSEGGIPFPAGAEPSSLIALPGRTARAATALTRAARFSGVAWQTG